MESKAKQMKIDETLIFEVDPTDVIIDKELPRHRKEMGDIKKMLESIQQFGQLQPIVISRDKKLICGGRRLAACLLGGFKARVVYKDTIDPIMMREMELEENVQRKALTPAEESFAIRDLVELKQKLYGKPTQGIPGGGEGFSLQDAAAVVGKSKGYIIEAMQLAQALDEFPELKKAKTKSEIKSGYKSLERTARNLDALGKYEETIKTAKEFVLVNRDAVDHITNIPDESMDIFLTDPPYGIDIDSVAMTIGGATGGDITKTGIKYEDTWDYARSLLEILIPESYRITKSTGHAYIFCGRDRFIFQWVYDAMTAAGWDVLKWPIVWIKRGSGQNNWPDRWPSSAYEAILYARKSNSRLVMQGRVDWIQVDPVPPSERTHQAEKPVPLVKELISRSCLPGEYLYDPCMGSGAIIQAAAEMKLFPTGCEDDPKSYANAVSRMVEWQANQGKSKRE